VTKQQLFVILNKLHPRRLKSMSLAQTVISSVFIAILIGAVSAGHYARNVIYKNKLMDTWAIMYLESEALAHRLNDALARQNSQPSTSERGVLTWDGKSSSLNSDSSMIPGPLPFKALGYDDGKQMFDIRQPRLRVLSFAGVPYSGSVTTNAATDSSGQQSMTIRPISIRIIRDLLTGKSNVSATTYVATREGKLIYTDHPSVTDVNFVSRPLVQRFISSPLSGALHEYNSKEGIGQFGFFVQVPETNLVLFSEAPQSVILSALREIMKQFGFVMLGITFVVVIGVSFPVTRLTSPLVELSHVARAIGAGDLTAKASLEGFGEVGALGEAFNSMIDGLNQRDVEISNLMVEKAEKIRIEAELKIARDIQANLLPQASLPAECGLEIAAAYQAATECAGDWYHYHYNVTARETIVAVVDVSGHGSGSSIFTALIAGVFDQFCALENGPWDLKTLADRIGKVVYRFGKGKWHATVLIARYRQDAKEVDLVSAGHTPAFVIHGREPALASIESKNRIAKKIVMPATILGDRPEVETCSRTISLVAGDLLFLYTDGFTEAKDPNGRMQTARNVEALLTSCEKLPPAEALEKVIQGWNSHRNGQPAADDACLVMLGAA
jgi:serine phosphatase RsbU (regulator of sigma subunit)